MKPKYGPEVVERVRELYLELRSAPAVSEALGGRPCRSWVVRKVEDLCREMGRSRRSQRVMVLREAVRIYRSGLSIEKTQHALMERFGESPSWTCLLKTLRREGVMRDRKAAHAERVRRLRAANATRTEVRRLALGGMARKEIAERLGIPFVRVRNWTLGLYMPRMTMARRDLRFRILELRARGLSAAEIGRRVGRCESTVRYYMRTDGMDGVGRSKGRRVADSPARGDRPAHRSVGKAAIKRPTPVFLHNRTVRE